MERTTAEKKPLKRQAIKQSGKIKSFKKTTNLELIFLGGLGEIGKNMLLLETDDQLFVIDAGLMFPTDETPGVDLILPDLTYLLEKKHKVKEIILKQ
jgi:ribonuclease J